MAIVACGISHVRSSPGRSGLYKTVRAVLVYTKQAWLLRAIRTSPGWSEILGMVRSGARTTMEGVVRRAQRDPAKPYHSCCVRTLYTCTSGQNNSEEGEDSMRVDEGRKG